MYGFKPGAFARVWQHTSAFVWIIYNKFYNSNYDLMTTWIWAIILSKYVWGVFNKILGKADCVTELGPRMRLHKSNNPGRIDSMLYYNIETHTRIKTFYTSKCIITIVHSDPANPPTRTNITFRQATTRKKRHFFRHRTHEIEFNARKYLSLSL